MKYLTYAAVFATLVLLTPLTGFARNANEHSLTISDPVMIGVTQLKPGNYKVEWQGSGPKVQVEFLQQGNTVATAPATLRTNDSEVTQDDIVMIESKKPGQLMEIDFAHHKEALVFAQSGS